MEITLLFFILAACVYVVCLRILESLKERFNAGIPLGDEECLAMMALKNRCSEYDIFHLAAENWQVPEKKIDHDFKIYLTKGLLPFYVRDYIRRHRADILD